MKKTWFKVCFSLVGILGSLVGWFLYQTYALKPQPTTSASQSSSIVVKNPSRAGIAPSQSSVILYSASWCHSCKIAKAYMREHHIKFEDRDVEASAKNQAEWESLSVQGVPTLLVGNQMMEGFDSDELEDLLKDQ